ncbi:mucin-21 [Nematostella vectensis]|uniref:mucin-21 n=1 Tax=Nematostella vectensis TaxID=45351 RepID=UPI0020771301|nr:mucin-21 [Nematostella vectensis]
MRSEKFLIALLLCVARFAKTVVGGCKMLPLDDRQTGKWLKNHPESNFTGITEDNCSVKCFLSDTCQSFNYNRSSETCQTSTSTRHQHPEDCVDKSEDVIYVGTKNACVPGACPSGKVCRADFVNGGFSCECPAGSAPCAASESLTTTLSLSTTAASESTTTTLSPATTAASESTTTTLSPSTTAASESTTTTLSPATTAASESTTTTSSPSTTAASESTTTTSSPSTTAVSESTTTTSSPSTTAVSESTTTTTTPSSPSMTTKSESTTGTSSQSTTAVTTTEAIPTTPDCASSTAVGLQDRSIIPDNSFSASSQYYSFSWPFVYPAKDARLHGDNYWAPGTLSNSYIQVHLIFQYTICAVATQGGASNRRVTHYKLSLSATGSTWNIYQENGADKVFNGNNDTSTVVKNELTNKPSARYIKFLPTSWNDRPALRLEVYGTLQ